MRGGDGEVGVGPDAKAMRAGRHVIGRCDVGGDAACALSFVLGSELKLAAAGVVERKR